MPPTSEVKERRPGMAIRGAEVLTIGESAVSTQIADILIEGQTIVDIGNGIAADLPVYPGDIDGTGKLAIPGLVNAHFHSPGTFMKGGIPGLPLDLYMLFEVPQSMDGAVSEQYARLRTLLGAVEMLKQGVTAVHDDAFFLPVVTDEEVDAVMAAYGESGIRATVALDQPNLSGIEKHALLAAQLPPPLLERFTATPKQSTDELLTAYERLISRWHGKAEGRLRAALSCSAPQRVEIRYFESLAGLSRDHEIPFNMHILETRAQRLFGDMRLGQSLVRYAAAHGALDHRTQVIHAIWIDDDDIAILSDRGVTVAHNPVCNLRLGSGTMPYRKLRNAGVHIAIGTDEANVDDGVNYWTALKVAGLVHHSNEVDFQAWPQPAEILRAATHGGYRSLCLPKPAGSIESGALADLALLDLDSLVFTPRHDVARHLVYGEPGRTVTHVMVNGEVVVADGVLTTVDEHKLVHDIREIQDEIDLYAASCTASASELFPYYDAAYREGLAMPVSASYGDASLALTSISQ